MKRINGWEGRLADYLEERRTMPFEWGTHDCCRFACTGLAAQGLTDPMAGVRAYKTARGATAAIKRLGDTLDDAATALAAKAGLVEVAPAFAGRGCVVLGDIETPGGEIEPALGLVDMDGTQAQFAGEDGLVWRPIKDCRRAWQFS